jgi:hypothetical protein
MLVNNEVLILIHSLETARRRGGLTEIYRQKASVNRNSHYYYYYCINSNYILYIYTPVYCHYSLA